MGATKTAHIYYSKAHETVNSELSKYNTRHSSPKRAYTQAIQRDHRRHMQRSDASQKKLITEGYVQNDLCNSFLATSSRRTQTKGKLAAPLEKASQRDVALDQNTKPFIYNMFGDMENKRSITTTTLLLIKNHERHVQTRRNRLQVSLNNNGLSVQ